MIQICITGTGPDGLPDLNQRYWLAGNPVKSNTDHSGVEDETRAITRQRQVDTGPGWPYALPADRQNESLQLAFRSTRLFASGVEAWRWRNAFSHIDAAQWPHPIEGDVIMRYCLPDGTHEDVRLHDCLLSKPQMSPEGLSLLLSYTLIGGRISPLAQGMVSSLPVALVSLGYSDSVQLALYGTGAGGAFDNATSSTGTMPTGSLAVGQRLYIGGSDDGAAVPEPFAKTFEVVTPGGSASGGRIAIDYPVEANLATIVAAFAGVPNVRCEIQNDGTRDYVYLGWTEAPEGAAGDVFISAGVLTSGGVAVYEGTSRADAFEHPGHASIPMDDAEALPVADHIP